jgi:hypothetical protein
MTLNLQGLNKCTRPANYEQLRSTSVNPLPATTFHMIVVGQNDFLTTIILYAQHMVKLLCNPFWRL